MSTDKGYIKIFRDIRDHWLWDDKPFDRGRAWIDLLMMVNHEDKKILFDGAPVPVYRGMTITSLHKLSDRWGWSVGKVNRFLNFLESEYMIKQERNTKRTIISICNYGVYQDSQNTKRNTEKTLNEHRRNTDGTKQDTREDTIEDTKKKKTAPSEPVIDDDDDGEDPMELLKRWRKDGHL